MDKIDKELQKLSSKERDKIKLVLKKIESGDVKSLDIKKLKDRNNIYRVRPGKIRIIFLKDSRDRIFIISISRRNEKTYKT